MSDSVRPQRRQPTRFPRPWDSPGKNTGVGCHFLLQCMKVKLLSHVQLFVTPWTAAHQAPPSMGFSRQKYWSGVPSPSPHSTPRDTQKKCPSVNSAKVEKTLLRVTNTQTQVSQSSSYYTLLCSHVFPTTQKALPELMKKNFL